MYSRVSGEAPQLLAAEVATAVGLCGSLVAVGTRRGAVVLYDTQGKLARAAAAGQDAGRGAALTCASSDAQVCRLPPHRAAVNDISFDATGAYVATASEDGNVAVRLNVSSVASALPRLTRLRAAGCLHQRRGALVV